MDELKEEIKHKVIEKYPEDVLKDIHGLIERNNSAAFIYKTINEKYGDKLVPVTATTMRRYVQKYKKQNHNEKKALVEAKLLTQFSEGIGEIEKLVSQINRQDDPEFNKVRLLEGLVGKCLVRINTLEVNSKDKAAQAGPGVDGAIVKYITEIRNIIESVLKMSALFRSDEQETVRLVRLESKMILELVRSVALEVFPEKYSIFSQKLKEKLQMQKITLDSVQTPKQASIEVTQVNEPESTEGQPTPADVIH